MKKGDYITILFNDIKDNVEFDGDVIALEKLLSYMLENNSDFGFNNWIYVLNKYNIEELMIDIDLSPLLISYPTKLIEKIGLRKLFILLNKLDTNKRKLIYNNLFNIYNKNCYLFSLFSNLINNDYIALEKESIYLILNNSIDFDKQIFDKLDFIKKIIILHLKNNKISLEFLKELTELPENNKDKAILKTILIDYIYD